jgi:hypothetical protein
MSRYIGKSIYKKAKTYYNLERREYCVFKFIGFKILGHFSYELKREYYLKPHQTSHRYYVNNLKYTIDISWGTM